MKHSAVTAVIQQWAVVKSDGSHSVYKDQVKVAPLVMAMKMITLVWLGPVQQLFQCCYTQDPMF